VAKNDAGGRDPITGSVWEKKLVLEMKGGGKGGFSLITRTKLRRRSSRKGNRVSGRLIGRQGTFKSETTEEGMIEIWGRKDRRTKKLFYLAQRKDATFCAKKDLIRKRTPKKKKTNTNRRFEKRRT